MSVDPVSLAITVALSAANMALTASRTIEGPRLDSTTFTGGDYGAALKMVWGKRREECSIFWAEDLREVKQRRKTKGGKFNDYTYYGTWAIALAGHEIGGVSRIWFDTHLVYDLSGAGPVTPFDFGEAGGNVSDFITIYTGTETQEPDPRMQATVEGLHGEGSCPAYRGTAYIVFKDVPLEKLGNRIPQVSVEMVSVADPIYPWETFPTTTDQPNRLWGATFSNDFSRFMWSNGVNYEIWDVAARAPMIAGPLPSSINLSNRLGLYEDGTFLAVSNDNHDLISFGADGLSAATQVDAFPAVVFSDRGQQEVRVIAAGGGEFYATIPWSTNRYFYTDAIPGAAISDGLSAGSTADLRMLNLTGVDWQPCDYFGDGDGAIWTVGRAPTLGTTTAYFYRIKGDSVSPPFLTVSGLPSHGSTFGDVSGCWHDGAFILAWDVGTGSSLYRIDPADGTILASRTGLTTDVYNTAKQFANFRPGQNTIWLNTSTTPYEINLADLTTIRTIDPTDWKAEGVDGVIYDPINNALICAPTSTQVITWRYLDRISGDGVPLSQICADVADDCGVEDYDFTALNQTIKGWSATRGQASNIIAPLIDAFDSEIRPHDFAISGVKRSGVSGGSISASRFVRSDERYQVKIKQAAELPRALLVNFSDTGADQQPATARADRPLDATGARGEQQIDLGTWATDATEARNITDRYFRRMWNERRGVSLSLTAQHLALEPGDVWTLDLDGENDIYRLTRITIKTDGALATEWKYDHPSLAVLDSATGAAFDGRTDSAIIIPLISKGFVLDVPLLSDVDNSVNPLVYALAAPYSDGAWPGAVVYEAVDGEYNNELVSIASSNAATWGTVAEVFAYTNPNIWDRSTELTVTLQYGELTGSTEAALNANPRLNLAAIGASGRWEIVQFTTATLVSGKTYTVSGFKRGRRGTEWAAELHAVNDSFVLLNAAASAEAGLSDVGTNELYKAITNGRTEGGTFPIAISPYEGQSLMPYAPCQLEGALDGSDWDLSWIRRTRVGGAWTGGTSIPVSEATEEYELEIMDGATVKRTVTGLTSPAYTYTAANQTTDFGSAQSSVTFRVYQISDAVGRGFVATATV
jgi:hypothetical protein